LTICRAKSNIGSKRIFFNTKEHNSWFTPRDQSNLNRATAKAGTVWDRVRIESDVEDAEDAPFKLVCKNCGKTCQLWNPAKWHHEHKACNAGGGVRYSMGRASTSTTAEDVELLVSKRAQTEPQCVLMTPNDAVNWVFFFAHQDTI
jgi:hypothetical protein